MPARFGFSCQPEKWSSRRGGYLSSRSTQLPWPRAAEQSLPRVITLHQREGVAIASISDLLSVVTGCPAVLPVSLHRGLRVSATGRLKSVGTRGIAPPRLPEPKSGGSAILREPRARQMEPTQRHALCFQVYRTCASLSMLGRQMKSATPDAAPHALQDSGSAITQTGGENGGHDRARTG